MSKDLVAYSITPTASRSNARSRLCAFLGSATATSRRSCRSAIKRRDIWRMRSTRKRRKARRRAPGRAPSSAACVGWLVGIGALAIPGIGPLVAAGPVVAALAGAGAAGATGGLVGGLIGAGIPEVEAKRYAGRIREGGYLISVHCDDQHVGEEGGRDSGRDRRTRRGEDVGSRRPTINRSRVSGSISGGPASRGPAAATITGGRSCGPSRL